MNTLGEIVFFDQEKGTGLIKCEGEDSLVHFCYTAVHGTIREGAKVKFELEDNGYGPVALNVRTMPGRPTQQITNGPYFSGR